jgi:hypothetical protein
MSGTLIALTLLCTSFTGHATRSGRAPSENERQAPEACFAQPVDPTQDRTSALPVVVRSPGVQPATIHPTRNFAIVHTAIYDAVNAAPTPFVSASGDYQSPIVPGCMFQGCGSPAAEHPRRTSLTPPMLTRQILWRQAEPKTLGARGNWWEVFKDPVLNGLEMQAGTGSLGMATTVVRIRRAHSIGRIGACGDDTHVALNFFDAMVRVTNSQPRSDQGECMRESAYDINELQVTLYTSYEREGWARVRRFTIGATLQEVEVLIFTAK